MRTRDEPAVEDSRRDDTDRERRGLAPAGVVVAGVAAMFLGFFITPDALIALGPMRTSLTSEIPSVRHVAQAEIAAFRLLCLGVAILPYFWGRLESSSFARRVRRHEPEEGAVDFRGDLFNFSLVASLACVTLGLVYVALGDRLFSNSQLFFINQEDGVIEYATAAVFLVSSMIAAILAFRSRRRWKRAAFLAAFSILFFVACGEEVSWGQRILGLETLDAFKGANVQNENNLHNLFGYLADHLFIAGVFAYGALFPALDRKSPFFHKLFDYVGLPIASLGLAVGFFAISGIHDWTVGRILGTLHALRVGELRELLSSVGFLLLMIETWRRLPETSPGASGVEPATA